jgi:hypothetical protein
VGQLRGVPNVGPSFDCSLKGPLPVLGNY